jgi:hypothetical protein
MGLDMFAYRTKVQISKPVDFQDEVYPSDENNEDRNSELMYWRKHPNLHGWMGNLYYEKQGKKDSFNCAPVELTSEDLDRLEKDVLENRLPHTDGFFFGESRPGINEKDLEFIKLAREAIAEGERVFYDSWW